MYNDLCIILTLTLHDKYMTGRFRLRKTAGSRSVFSKGRGCLQRLSGDQDMESIPPAGKYIRLYIYVSHVKNGLK